MSKQTKAKPQAPSASSSTAPGGSGPSHHKTSQRKHSTAASSSSSTTSASTTSATTAKSPSKRPIAPAMVGTPIKIAAPAQPQQIQLAQKTFKTTKPRGTQPQQSPSPQQQSITTTAPIQPISMTRPHHTPHPTSSQLSSNSDEFFPSMYKHQHATTNSPFILPQTPQLSPQLSPPISFTLDSSSTTGSPNQLQLGFAVVTQRGLQPHHHSAPASQLLSHATQQTTSTTSSTFKGVQHRNTLQKPTQPTMMTFNPKHGGVSGQQRRQFSSSQAHNSHPITSPLVSKHTSATGPTSTSAATVNGNQQPKPAMPQYEQPQQMTTTVLRRALHTKPASINASFTSPAKFVPGTKSTKNARDALGEEPVAKKSMSIQTPFPNPFGQVNKTTKPATTAATPINPKPNRNFKPISQQQQQQPVPTQSTQQQQQQFKPQSHLTQTILGNQNPLLAAVTLDEAPKQQRRQQGSLNTYGNPAKQHKRGYATRSHHHTNNNNNSTNNRPNQNRHKKQQLPHLFQISSEETPSPQTRLSPSSAQFTIAKATMSTQSTLAAIEAIIPTAITTTTTTTTRPMSTRRPSRKIQHQARRLIDTHYTSLIAALPTALSTIFTKNKSLLSIHKRTFLSYINGKIASSASSIENRDRFDQQDAYRVYRPDNDQYWGLPQHQGTKPYMTQFNSPALNISSGPVFYTAIPPQAQHQEPFSNPVLKIPMAKMNANLDYQKQQEPYQGWDQSLLDQINPDGSLKSQADTTSVTNALLMKQADKLQRERDAVVYNIQVVDQKLHK